MKKEKEIVIISGFVGFAIGVCSMMAINVDKEVKQVEKLDNTRFIIQENIGTCEDMIEWMNYDDSTGNEMYIFNLENMVNHNRSILYKTSVEGLDLQTEYDY